MEDSRLYLGLSVWPMAFDSISNFVYSVLTDIYGLQAVNYLDDFVVVAKSVIYGMAQVDIKSAYMSAPTHGAPTCHPEGNRPPVPGIITLHSLRRGVATVAGL